MDASYGSNTLGYLRRELGCLPIVTINLRGSVHPLTLDATEKMRLGDRTVVECINSRWNNSCALLKSLGHVGNMTSIGECGDQRNAQPIWGALALNHHPPLCGLDQSTAYLKWAI